MLIKLNNYLLLISFIFIINAFIIFIKCEDFCKAFVERNNNEFIFGFNYFNDSLEVSENYNYIFIGKKHWQLTQDMMSLVSNDSIESDFKNIEFSFQLLFQNCSSISCQTTGFVEVLIENKKQTKHLIIN